MVYIALPEDVSLDKKMACEEKISKILAGLGANLQINWVRVLPQDNPKTTPIWTTPIFWAGFFASLTVLIRLGIVGVLYTLLSAIIGYCVSWFFLTEDGEKQILEIMKKFGR